MVGVVILLGPRVEALVSVVLEQEARKRSRFPPGLEPQGAAGTTAAAARGAGNPNGKQVRGIDRHDVMLGRVMTSIRTDRLMF